MAYKFQLGDATMSGSLIQRGDIAPASSDGSALGSADKEFSDLFLADAAVIKFGDDQEVTLTHVHNTGLLLSDDSGIGTTKLQFGDSGTYINQSTDGTLSLVSDNIMAFDAQGTDSGDGFKFTLGTDNSNAKFQVQNDSAAEKFSVDATGAGSFAGSVTAVGSFIIGSADLNEADMEKIDGITNGTAAADKALVLDSNKDIGTIRNLTIDGTFSDGNYTFDTSGNVTGLGTVGCGAITSTGTSTFAGGITPAAANGAALGSASKEWADLYLADGGIAYFGNDQEVQLEHDADDGLKLRNVNAASARPARLILELSSSSPADNDQVANIRGVGYNDNEQSVIFSQILTKATDVSDGAEDGGIINYAMVNGTLTEMMDISVTAAGETTMQEIVNLPDHDGSSKGLKLGGTLVTATAAEINAVDVTAGTGSASKAIVLDATGIARLGDGTADGFLGQSADANQLRFGADNNFAIYYDEAMSDALVVAGLQNAEAALSVVAHEADDASVRIVADQGDGAADGWEMKVQHANHKLTFGNDIASQGTYVSHLTIEPNASVASSTVTAHGNLTVAGNLTVQGSTTTVDSTTINISSSFTFEGPADAHETILSCATPGADTTLNLPTLSAGTFYIPALADAATDASAAVTAAEFALLDGGSTIGTDALVSADGFMHNDNGTMKQTQVVKIAELAFSMISGDATANSAGALTIAAGAVESDMLNDDIISGQAALGGASVAQADLLMIDDGPGTVKKVTFSNFEDSIFGNISGDATVAAGGALTIANDAVEQAMIADDAVGADQLASNAVVNASVVNGSLKADKLDIDGSTDIGADLVDADLIIVDDGAGGTNRKCAMSRVKTYIGSGLLPVSSGSNGATLAEGFNYFANHGSAISASLPANLSVGESVIIKAGSDCDTSKKLTIEGYADHTIDGAGSIILESPFAAVQCVYTVSGSWRVL